MRSLFALPHAEVRMLLRSGAPVYLPVNPVEYHGPHLPLLTDGLICEGLIEDLHARLVGGSTDAPPLVAPDLRIGVGPTPGPGSRPVAYGLVRSMVVDACRALLELGAQRVVLMTFHGHPLHCLAVEAGARHLRRRGVPALTPFHVALREMIEMDPNRYAAALAHVEDPREREEMLAGLGRDFHAGFLETSLLLYYAPEAVSPAHRSLPPCPMPVPHRGLSALARLATRLGRPALARELEYGAYALGWYRLRPFPGYTGWPHRAAASAGRLLAELIAERSADLVVEFFAGRAPAPRPIMTWLAVTSLGGRLGKPPV